MYNLNNTKLIFDYVYERFFHEILRNDFNWERFDYNMMMMMMISQNYLFTRLSTKKKVLISGTRIK